ncbi:translation initiation factor IF-2-like [Acinonyx jubatus]|uniref:Translation initiation factor IF-2-like n=1 Tax=Acinonyx jubatus TaxID=32536 RepID=A0ABM3QAY2_ACIJB|nr:translation initiation factor IF-2-like [Acinonyx jubatus]
MRINLWPSNSTYRKVFAPPISPSRFRGSPRSRELGAGGAEKRGLPAVPPASRAEQAGTPARVVPRQGRGSGQGLPAFPPGDKGWAHALRRQPAAPAAWRRQQSSRRSRPGSARGGWGRGQAPPPLPRRAPGDLLIKISAQSRRWSSYLCATAAGDPPAPAAPTHCTNDSSPAALKIPDKEPRNSRFPTSQSLDPACAPPPVAAVTAATAASNSASRPRETGPRGRRETAHAPPARWRSGRAYPSSLLGAPRPLLGPEAGAVRPIPRRRGGRAHSLVRPAAPSRGSRALARL